VILEWRELFEGNVYERHFFSEIDFDVPVDPALFTIPRPPGRRPPSVWNVPSTLGSFVL